MSNAEQRNHEAAVLALADGVAAAARELMLSPTMSTPVRKGRAGQALRARIAPLPSNRRALAYALLQEHAEGLAEVVTIELYEHDAEAGSGHGDAEQ